MTYDYAWNQPGWTSQNPSSTGPNLPAPPAGLTEVPVIGTFYDQEGRPIWGRLTFTPSTRQVHVSPGVSLVLEPFSLTLRNGTVPDNLTLLSPDGSSQTLIPASWTWDVKGRIGPANVQFGIDVPNQTSPVDLTVLAATDISSTKSGS